MIQGLPIILASLCWALDTLFRYPLLNSGNSAFSLVYWEHLFLVLAYIPLYFKIGPLFKKMTLVDFFLFCVLGGGASIFATLCFTQAFATTSPTIIILTQKIQPIFAIIGSYFFLKESLGKEFWFWALITMFGVFLLNWSELSWAEASSFNAFLQSGPFQGLVAAFFWAIATVIGKSLRTRYTTFQVSGLRYLFGFIFAFVAFYGLPKVGLTWGLPTSFPEIIPPYPDVFWKVILMTSLGGGISFILYYYGLGKVSASMATLLELSFPLFAAIINWVFLKDRFTLLQLIGGILVLLGPTLLELRRKRVF